MNEHTIKVVTKFNKDIISQHLEGGQYILPRRNYAEEIIKLKEEGVREALIKLGWTPPSNQTNNL